MVSISSLSAISLLFAAVVLVLVSRFQDGTEGLSHRLSKDMTDSVTSVIFDSSVTVDLTRSEVNKRRRRLEDATAPTAANGSATAPTDPPVSKPEGDSNTVQPDPNDPIDDFSDLLGETANGTATTDAPQATANATTAPATDKPADAVSPTEAPQTASNVTNPPATDKPDDAVAPTDLPEVLVAPTDAPKTLTNATTNTTTTSPATEAVVPTDPPQTAPPTKSPTTTAPQPTDDPTNKPTEPPPPTPSPTVAPKPTDAPTTAPKPTDAPTTAPKPTDAPTTAPKPTDAPTTAPKPSDAPTTAPKPTLDPKALNPDDWDDEGGVGAVFWLFLLICIGGGAYYFKDRIKFPTGPGGFSLGGVGGGGPFGGPFGGPAGGSGVKYEHVAVDEEDEEWGWGDEDGNDDIELTPSFAMDTNLHNRRPSNDTAPLHKPGGLGHLPKKSPRRPSPLADKMAMDSMLDMPNLPPQPARPAPATAPVVGLAVKKTTGMSLKPKAAPPLAPSSMGAPSMPTSQGSTPFHPTATSVGGAPLQITSLGTKKPAVAPVKKAPAPSTEDDIFASMGLSAKPTFTHAPAPASRPTPSTTANRWATTPAPATTPVSTFSSMQPAAASTALNATTSGGDDDADWGDDDDLNDLLDD